ncbi:phage tail protein [Amycolatopsis sp. NPDC059027]|uniref:phage tail tube protein n=1 Tax=unclassified Amycolatopsis TaxID=2618356 RepID=UPI00366EB7ED
MPGLNANEIRVAGTGSIFVAPAHTPAPADFTKSWDAPWVNLGYTSADGVKFVKKDKLDPVDTWQSVASIRYVFSDRDLSVKFSLLQLNADTLPFFFASPSPATPNVYEIAAAPRVDERALGIEFSDGPTVRHRFYIPRGVVTETEETAVTRTAAIKLGVTFTALTPINARFEPLAQWSMNQTAPTAATAETEEQHA